MTIEDLPIKFWTLKAQFEIEFKRRYGIDVRYTGLSHEQLLIMFYAFDSAHDAARDCGRKLGYPESLTDLMEDTYVF